MGFVENKKTTIFRSIHDVVASVSSSPLMTTLQRPHHLPTAGIHFYCFYISRLYFLHICCELKLSSAVKMSPQWKSDLISPPWFNDRFPWCTRFIVFNLLSQVAYQAADGESEMKTPHISSTDCCTSDIQASMSWSAQDQLNPCSLQRHFGNGGSEGSSLSARATSVASGSQREACTVFPACSKVVFYHLS